LTPSDDPGDPYPETLENILMDSQENVFKHDPDAIIQDVGGQKVIYTIDEFAFIDGQD